MNPRQSSWPISNDRGADRSLRSPAPSAGPDMDPESSSSRTLGHTLEVELHPHDMSLIPSSQKPSSDSIAFWKACIDKLSIPEREMFLKHGAGDLTGYVVGLEKICKEQGETSRATKVARLVKPLFNTMNMYAPIAQTMIQADPTSSSLILGGITCIMSISSRFLDYQEKIVNMLSEMGEKLEILLEYSSDIYPNDDQVQRALMAVFGDVLQFCSEAWSLFRHKNGEPRSSVKTFLTSLGKSFEMKFGDIVDKFYRDLTAFQDRALLCDRRGTRAYQSMQVQFMKHQIFETRKNYSGIMSMGQNMLATANQGVLEEAQNRKQRLIEDAQKKREEEDKAKEDKRRKIIGWLPYIEFHKEQEEKFLKRLPGTGQWLLESTKFQLWKTEPRSDLLWIYGKRGCGKSYLASRVIQDLSEAYEESSIDKQNNKAGFAFAYIYCNSLDSTKIEPSKLLGSILKQLCHFLPKPEIETSLEKLYDRHSEARLPDGREIKEAIMAILGRFTRTFLIVDGLDECNQLDDDQFQDLCEFVHSLTLPRADNSLVKVVAFSRPEYAKIKEAFAGCSYIQVDAGASNEDIKQFISIKLSGSGLHVKKTPGLLAEAEKILLSGADGMFLWVDLVVNSLKGERKARDIKAKLEDFPRDLDDVYEDAMRRILEKKDSVRTLALTILLWTANAKRPLSRNELLEALAVEPGMRELKPEDRIPDDDDFARDCADLIVLDNDGYYHLFHSSLKDYLRSAATAKFNVPTEYRVMQTNADKILAEICLTYLTFEKFKSGGPAESLEELKRLLEENPFFEYTSTFWGRHAAAANALELKSLMNEFLFSDGARELSMQLFMLVRGEEVCPYPGKSTPLHLLSIFNLAETARSMPEIEALQTKPDGFHSLPLDYALAFQSRQMCNWLLERPNGTLVSEKPPECRNAPIHAAASNDWGEIVESLIAWKYDPESTIGDRKQAPLHIAACQGSESALEALINAKVNINVGEIDGTTALIDAAENNHPRFAQRLLDQGAEINIQGWNGTTALHHAAKNGDTSLAKQLLQKGADKNSTCSAQWGFRTPLHLAAEENSHEILELLIAGHADIEKAGPSGFNALLLSCTYGHLNCVMSLLDAGAKIASLTGIKQTVLHVAASGGHLDILHALFEKRPRQSRDLISSGDDEGDTPLHCAVLNGRKAEAKLLLEKGALPDKTNDKGLSALHVAIIEGETELGQLLLKVYKADAKLKTWIAFPPLHYAASYGRVDFIPLLLEAGVDPEDTDSDSRTAVHVAADAGQVGFVVKLHEAVPALELAPKSSTDKTPLHYAADDGSLDLVKFFLSQKASSVQTMDHSQNLPFHNAAWKGHFKVLEQLLTKENMNSPGYRGRTALFGAATGGHTQLVQHL